MNARDNTPTVCSVQTALGAATGDGFMTVQDLVRVTHLKDAEVRAQLKSLHGTGALESIPGRGPMAHRYRMVAAAAVETTTITPGVKTVFQEVPATAKDSSAVQNLQESATCTNSQTDPDVVDAEFTQTDALMGMVERLITAWVDDEDGCEAARVKARTQLEDGIRELTRQASEALALGVLEEAMPGFTAEVVAQKDAVIALLREDSTKSLTEFARVTTLLRDDMFAVMQDRDSNLRMFQAAVSTLAAIDRALELPDDGCNSPEQTLEAIERLTAERTAANKRFVSQAAPSLYVIPGEKEGTWRRFKKYETALAAAMKRARRGKYAPVLGLVPMGMARPGAEWVDA